MPLDPIKRNRYFHPGGGPGGTDYTFDHTGEHHYQDQTEFYRALARVDSSHLRGDFGIAAGLEVSGANGDAAVVVAEGAAVNGDGETIVLAVTAQNGIDGGHADIGANPPGGQHQEVTVPASVPLAALAGETVYVTISHSEISRPAEGSGGRMEQVPWLRLQPTGTYVDDGASVILAIVDVTGGGTLSNLRATDAALPHGRRLLGRSMGPLRLKRRRDQANTLSEETAGTIAERSGGGLLLTVPGSGDVVSFERAGGSLFSALEVRAQDVVARDSGNRDVLRFDSSIGRLTVGASGNSGDVRVRDGSGRTVFDLDSSIAWLRVGTDGNEGDIEVQDGEGRQVMHMNGGNAALTLGAVENAGDLVVRDNAGNSAIHAAGSSAWLRVGTVDNEGDIEVQDARARSALHFNGETAWLRVGVEGNEGDIEVQDGAGRRVMHMNGEFAALYLGTEGNEGDLVCRDNNGADTIHLNGGDGRIYSNGRIIAGNPARYVSAVWLFADDGTSTQEIDLGSPRRVFAFVSMTGCDPRAGFDAGDAFAFDVFKIDGGATSGFLHGGAHLGGEGASSNIFAQTYRGTAQRIMFRCRSFQDATGIGIGVVFYE